MEECRPTALPQLLFNPPDTLTVPREARQTDRTFLFNSASTDGGTAKRPLTKNVLSFQKKKKNRKTPTASADCNNDQKSKLPSDRLTLFMF